ncbi:hypothetical protein M407DRAFT_26784 [Tulasnella calospora MUT 4182]|uniref:Uncharacterized protein n=1 Tax=Tulasnella calospora MUT 4182 TaxID=1051891 RepID=A0A0C3QF41_9AGAM|nr:hypothetical protein M407DRAFT_26784 [Tulasnella calospora MUT 4182]
MKLSIGSAGYLDMREMMEHSTPLATEDPKEAIWDLNPFDVQTLQQSTATSRIRTSVELPATAMAHSTYRYNLLRSYHAISASRNAKVLATWVQHREKFFDGSLWYLGGEKQGQTQLAPVFHPEEKEDAARMKMGERVKAMLKGTQDKASTAEPEPPKRDDANL